jgi:hypothetical protein
MNYQETLKLAEEVVLEMKKKTSMDKIDGQLVNRGFYASDVNNIIFKALNLLEEEYGNKLKGYLLAGTSRNKQPEFEVFDDSVYESLSERIRRNIIEETSKKIKQLATENISDSEIIRQTVSPCVSEDEVKVQIENYRQFVETPKGDMKYKLLTIGTISTLIGLTLVIYSFMHNHRWGKRLGVGLIAYGVYNFIKAISPKGVRDTY